MGIPRIPLYKGEYTDHFPFFRYRKQNQIIAESFRDQDSAAILIQNAYKSQRLKKRVQTLKRADPITQTQNRQKVFTYLQKNTTPQSVLPFLFVRDPLVNVSKKPNLTKPEKKFTKAVSHERFIRNLRKCFGETLHKIQSTKNSSYIILSQETDSSHRWVLSQVVDMTIDNPPKAIINFNNLREYLENNPNIEHFIVVDDASYSGIQLKGILLSSYLAPSSYEIVRSPLINEDDILTEDIIIMTRPSLIENKTLHICIPYMTSYAKQSVKKILRASVKLVFSNSQLMPSYLDLCNLGYFGYTKIPRPNIEHLSSLVVSEKIGLSANEKKKSKAVDEALENLKERLFKIPDSHIPDEIDKTSKKIQSLKKRLTLPGNRFNAFCDHLIEELQKTAIYVERSGFSQELHQKTFKAYAEKIDTPRLAIRTPICFSHKCPDGVSIDKESVESSLVSKEIPPPYKSSESLEEARNTLICTAKQQTPSSYNPYGDEEFVLTNRGAILLANNYRENLLDNRRQMNLLVIDIEGKDITIPFGGKDGAFQWKLREGDIFSLKHPHEKDFSRFLEYRNGSLH